jgi:hypothetical protein
MAPDGREYMWKLGPTAPHLYLNDEHKTPVAKFHLPCLRWFRRPGAKSCAWMEIFPEGEHLVDVILLTFIYVEKIRKDRESAAKTLGG